MEKLDVNRINAKAPYLVTFDSKTNLYKFASTYNVSLSVGFEENDLLEKGDSYQFVLTNYEGKKSPRDLKVRDTVMAIIEEFFLSNEAALLYICETGDGLQKCEIVCYIFGLVFMQKMTNFYSYPKWFTMRKIMKITQH